MNVIIGHKLCSFDNNLSIYCALIALIVLYAIGMFFAKLRDMNDVRGHRSLALADNLCGVSMKRLNALY